MRERRSVREFSDRKIKKLKKTLDTAGVVRDWALGGDCASSTNHLLVNYMPPRTTRKSYRPRASDRTMVGIFCTVLLVASETEDVLTTAT